MNQSRFRLVSRSDITFAKEYYRPAPLREADVMFGDRVWADFYGQLPNAIKDTYEAFSAANATWEPIMRGYALSLITGRDAYCPEAPTDQGEMPQAIVWLVETFPAFVHGACAFQASPRLASQMPAYPRTSMTDDQLDTAAENLLSDAYWAPAVRGGEDIQMRERLTARLNRGDDPEGEVTQSLALLDLVHERRDELMSFSLQVEFDEIGRLFSHDTRLAVELRMAQNCDFDEIEGYQWSRHAWDAETRL